MLSAIDCDVLLDLLSLTDGRAGSRTLLANPRIEALARHVRMHPAMAPLLPHDAVAVQCTLFSKSVDTNWSVAPHQDLSIPVAKRVPAPQCTGWSTKQGVTFVQPPATTLASLVAVRLQLDDHADVSGPLDVLPGSHRHGRLTQDQLATHRATTPALPCIVARGGAVVMRPLIVHASGKAESHHPRRVLHLLFGPRSLPFGLRWAQAV